MLDEIETQSYKGCYLIPKNGKIQILSASARGKEIYIADDIASAKTWIEKHDSIAEQKKIAYRREKILGLKTP